MPEGVEPSNISDQSYLKNKSMILTSNLDELMIFESQKLISPVYQNIDTNYWEKKSLL